MSNLRHGYRWTPTYTCWLNMKDRCNNKNNINYRHYGGRRITVCKRWNKFENFLKDMGEKPEGLTLDRIDNNKGYYKDNCRWTNWKQQNNNRREKRVYKNSKSGVKGISWNKRDRAWIVQVCIKDKIKYLGYSKKLDKAKEILNKYFLEEKL